MIRIRYRDSVLVLGLKDASNGVLEFTPDEQCSWMSVINEDGFVLEYLDGGQREPAIEDAAIASVEALDTDKK